MTKGGGRGGYTVGGWTAFLLLCSIVHKAYFNTNCVDLIIEDFINCTKQ